MAETERAKRPFWIHQFIEYVIGFALIAFGFQDTHPVVPAVVGVVVVVNAAVVHGPFGAFRLINRTVHRWVDVLVMAFLVLAAVQPWVTVRNDSRFVMVAIAIVWVVVWLGSSFHEKPKKVRSVDSPSEEAICCPNGTPKRIWA